MNRCSPAVIIRLNSPVILIMIKLMHLCEPSYHKNHAFMCTFNPVDSDFMQDVKCFLKGTHDTSSLNSESEINR